MKSIIQNTKEIYCTHDANLTVSGILVIVYSLTIHGSVEKYWKERNTCHFAHPICFFVLLLFARELRNQIGIDMWRQTEGYLG